MACTIAGLFGFLFVSGVIFALVDNEPSAEDRIEEYLSGTDDKEFFAADGQFRANFPTLPQRTTEQTDIAGSPIDITMYLSEIGSVGFAVSFLPLEPNQPYDTNLAINGAAAAIDGQVQSAAATTWQGFEAIEGLITVDDQTVRVMVIRTPERAYQITIGGPGDSLEAYEQFKTSFEIVT